MEKLSPAERLIQAVQERDELYASVKDFGSVDAIKTDKAIGTLTELGAEIRKLEKQLGKKDKESPAAFMKRKQEWMNQ